MIIQISINNFERAPLICFEGGVDQSESLVVFKTSAKVSKPPPLQPNLNRVEQIGNIFFLQVLSKKNPFYYEDFSFVW